MSVQPYDVLKERMYAAQSHLQRLGKWALARTIEERFDAWWDWRPVRVVSYTVVGNVPNVEAAP